MTVVTRVDAVEARFLHKDATSHTLQIRSVRWTETDDERIGEWGIELANPRSRVVGKVRALDEVEIWVQRDGGALTRVMTGVLERPTRHFHEALQSTVDASGLHFEAVLQDRHVTKSVTRPTDAGALIHTVMDDNDIGLTLTNVPAAFGTDVDDVVFNYVDYREFLTRIAGMVGAAWHIDANRDLHFYPRASVSSGISENGSGGAGFSFDEDASTVVNVQRGIGGTSKVQHGSQTNQTAYTRVTPSTSKTARVLWPREEVALFEIWCKAVPGSAASLEVRIEADDGASNPSGIPLARYLVQAQDIPSAGGYAVVFFPRHIIGPGSYVHFIAQATAVEGVDVGVDAGNMTFRAYIGYPVASERSDAASIALYGRREGRLLADGDITSLEDLNLRLEIQIAKFAYPLTMGRFSAVNPAYLTAPLGSTMVVNMPELDASLNARTIVIKERRHEIKGRIYTLDVVLSDGEREREAGSLLAGLVRRVEFLEASSLRDRSNAIQLVQATDSVGLTDTGTVETWPTGDAAYDTAQYDMEEYA